MLVETATNILIGVLAGIAWCFVAKKAWNETYEWVRRIVLGAIVATIYLFMGVYAITGAEDTMLIVTSSYVAVDWFTALEVKRRGDTQ